MDLPITIQVPEEYLSDAGYVQAFENSVETWNSALGTNIFSLDFKGVDVSTTKPLPLKSGDFVEDNLFSLIFPSQWVTNSHADVLAVTVFSYAERTKRIVHADVIFNKKNFNFTTSEIVPLNSVDLESVLTHELGHFLGLGHVCQTENERKTKGKCESTTGSSMSSYNNYESCTENSGVWKSSCVGEIDDEHSLDSNSIMNISLTKGTKKRNLSSKDVEQIQEKYK